MELSRAGEDRFVGRYTDVRAVRMSLASVGSWRACRDRRSAMAAYLFESVERRLTPQMIRQISAFLDERPSSTRKAIAVALPALMAGLNERASSARGAE